MPSIQLRNQELFYEDTGEGFPLLLGHSYLWTSKMWQSQIERLSKHFRCIATDLWDHGNSGRLEQPGYNLSQCAEDHWMLMQHLGISEFGVIGLSVGGMWGTHLALNHPEAVKCLILMDTYVGPEPSVSQQQYFGMLDQIEKDQAMNPEMIEVLLPFFFSPHTFANKVDIVEAFRKDLLAIRPEQIPGIVQMGRIIFSRKDLTQELTTLTQPALVVVGRDDIPRPPKESKEMADLLPNGELQIIEQAGHITAVEQPEAVNTCLRNFLDQVLVNFIG